MMKDDHADEKVSENPGSGPITFLLYEARRLERQARESETNAVMHRNEAISLEKHAAQLYNQALELRKAAQALT